MPAVSRMLLVVTMSARGIAEIQRANKHLDDLAGPGRVSSLKRAGTALLGITAGLATAGFAAKEAYDFINQGAQLDLTRRRFEVLSTSIGTTAAALEIQLHGAIRGLLSDAEAVTLATDLMRLGLATNTEEVVRLANVSSQLGFDLNELVLTLTNQTVRRFDTLGVSVDGFRERYEELQETMSREEAFKLAFIEQAEAQIPKVGDLLETTAGRLKVAENLWKSSMENIKLSVINNFAEIIDYLAANQPVQAVLRQAERLYIESGLNEEGVAGMFVFRRSLEDLVYRLAAVNSEMTIAQARAQVYRGALDALAEGTATTNDELWALITSYASFPRLSAGFVKSVDESTRSIIGMGRSADTAAGKIQKLLGFFGQIPDFGFAARFEFSQIMQNLDDLESRPLVVERRKEWREQQQILDGIKVEAKEAAGSMEEYKTEVEKAAEAMAQLSAQTGNAFEQMRRLDEFKPENIFYQKLLDQGASAAQLRDFLIASGLESEERANEIFQQAQWASFADMIAESIARRGGSVEEGWALAQRGLEDPQLAGEFSGATIVQGDEVYSINFYGDVIDIQMIRDMIDEAINAAKTQEGITS